jgi:hypothetical protein
MSYTVIDAAVVDETGNTTPINGIPNFHTKTFGQYNGKYPYVAASKALTSIYKHLSKYPEWFPSHDKNNPPSVVFVLRNTETDKLYSYMGSRTAAPQSLDEPRVILGRYGRPRVYKWQNKVEPVPLSSVGY